MLDRKIAKETIARNIGPTFRPMRSRNGGGFRREECALLVSLWRKRSVEM
jgi:hypothetical protein